VRTLVEVLNDSRPYQQESVARSWWYVLEANLVLAIWYFGVWYSQSLWVQTLGALLIGLTWVRIFILFHDFHHFAILKNSKLAAAYFEFVGLFLLSPGPVWRETHDYHHANNAKLIGSQIGSFPTLDIKSYQVISRKQQLMYHFVRSPIFIALGYITTFFLGMCIFAFSRQPKVHWRGPVAIVLQILLVGSLVYFFGWQKAMFLHLLPMFSATAAGTYLFYAQHNFPDARLATRKQWTFLNAALHSSSYIKMGPIMRWFTGNIGYHHVHHLNARIPFYNLPAAMENIPELSHPHTITLWPKDVVACLKLALWDPESQRFLTMKEARKIMARQSTESASPHPA